jgi:tetratricopeptide (TPR) repeat protein
MLFALIAFLTGITMVPATEIPESLSRLTEIVMANEVDGQSLAATAERAAQEISTVSPENERRVLESRRLFQLGIWALGRGETRQADQYFTSSLEQAEQALSISESTEAYRSVSNALQQLLGTRGFFFQAANAGRALESARRAVELDGAHAGARLTLVSFLSSAPGMVGGDPAEARFHLEEARSLSPGGETITFLLAIWTARLAAKSGNRSLTENSLREARAIYPNSWFLAETENVTTRDLASR